MICINKSFLFLTSSFGDHLNFDKTCNFFKDYKLLKLTENDKSTII